MSTVRIGINGFGRIGRLTLRATLGNSKGRVTAINDPFMDRDYLMYLLKYDSVHGNLKGTVEKADGGIKVNGDFIRLTHETDPFLINWGAVGADYIAECTGVFLNTEMGQAHIMAGARKTILSAPPKD